MAACLSALVARYRPVAAQFLRFAVIGGLGFVVDTAVTYGAIGLFGWGPYVSGFFAFPFAVTATWIGNRLFTFREAVHQPMAVQWAKFASVCAVGLGLNRGTYCLVLMLWPLAYQNPVLGLLAGTGAGMFFNFFFARKFVFRA